jgi:voltage-gated sodium channel
MLRSLLNDHPLEYYPMNSAPLQQRLMKLRSHKAFELFVVSVIIASALLVGAKTYDLHPVTQNVVI